MVRARGLGHVNFAAAVSRQNNANGNSSDSLREGSEHYAATQRAESTAQLPVLSGDEYDYERRDDFDISEEFEVDNEHRQLVN